MVKTSSGGGGEGAMLRNEQMEALTNLWKGATKEYQKKNKKYSQNRCSKLVLFGELF